MCERRLGPAKDPGALLKWRFFKKTIDIYQYMWYDDNIKSKCTSRIKAVCQISNLKMRVRFPFGAYKHYVCNKLWLLSSAVEHLVEAQGVGVSESPVATWVATTAQEGCNYDPPI